MPTRKVFNPNHGIAQKPSWAHSLAWLEHPADNREVTGPNPVGPTFLLLADFYEGPHRILTVGASHACRTWENAASLRILA